MSSLYVHGFHNLIPLASVAVDVMVSAVILLGVPLLAKRQNASCFRESVCHARGLTFEGLVILTGAMVCLRTAPRVHLS